MRTLRRTGNHDDDPRMDRYEETPAWSSIPCHCGARYRVAPWGDAARWQCEACEEADARADAGLEATR